MNEEIKSSLKAIGVTTGGILLVLGVWVGFQSYQSFLTVKKTRLEISRLKRELGVTEK